MFIKWKILVLIAVIIKFNDSISQVDIISTNVVEDSIKVMILESPTLKIVTDDSLASSCKKYSINIPDSLNDRMKIVRNDNSCNFFIRFFDHDVTDLIVYFQIKDVQNNLVNTIPFKIQYHPPIRPYFGGIKDTIIDDLNAFIEKPYFIMYAGFAIPEPWIKTESYQLTIFDHDGKILKEYPEILNDTLTKEQVEFLKTIPKNSVICFLVVRTDADRGGKRHIGREICYYFRGG
ncbi:hypothetical protein [Brumimicrobium mesophilum]|uniref:hypothetical protein n=1 Tax=Brumimicrobium mesophilum TaxID=392717 RepID=UPI000D13EFF6|nr:hypothetical protein [Brumimicrobium mesophilum]